MMNGAIGVVVVLIFLSLLFTAWIAVEYILSALGLYKFAVLRGIDSAWMSWIPIFRDWTVGKLAEKADEADGIRRKWGLFLVIMDGLIVCSAILMGFVYILFMIYIVENAASLDGLSTVDFTMIQPLLSGLVLVIIAACFTSIVSTAGSTAQMICMYKVFEYHVESKAWKSWLIYLLVPIYGSYHLYQCAKRAGELQQGDFQQEDFQQEDFQQEDFQREDFQQKDYQ